MFFFFLFSAFYTLNVKHELISKLILDATSQFLIKIKLIIMFRYILRLQIDFLISIKFN